MRTKFVTFAAVAAAAALIIAGVAGVAGVAGLAGLATAAGPNGSGSLEGRPAPEFPSLSAASWSGPPTSMSSLRGRVVLLNVWTFGCINCDRTLPWVRSTSERYRAKGLAVIGVHSPEFERERDPDEVESARKRNHLDYPSFLDNGHAYWRALRNQYWPTLYLIDRGGIIRAIQVGEVHEGDEVAASLDRRIAALLDEPAPSSGGR